MLHSLERASRFRGVSLILRHIAYLLLIVASQGCQLTPVAEDSDSEEIIETSAQAADLPPTPMPAGHSRSNPWPPAAGSLLLAPWEVDLLETKRGDEAWQLIQAANPFNDPAGEGWEYLLVKLAIKNRENDAKPSELGLHVTGRGLVTHFSFNAAVVVPEPRLETRLGGNGQSEGWKAFRIRQGEEALILIVNDMSDTEEPPRYLALEAGAAIPVSEQSLQSITPTQLGSRPDDPVPFGLLGTMEDWQVRVQEMIVGEAAWQRLYETNRFNDPPEAGMMYLAVRLQIGYIGLDPHGSTILASIIQLRDDSGNEYRSAPVVSPDPDLFFQLFPGGFSDGWIVFSVPESSNSWILDFHPERFSESTQNRRYLSLTSSGR